MVSELLKIGLMRWHRLVRLNKAFPRRESSDCYLSGSVLHDKEGSKSNSTILLNPSASDGIFDHCLSSSGSCNANSYSEPDAVSQQDSWSAECRTPVLYWQWDTLQRGPVPDIHRKPADQIYPCTSRRVLVR